MNTIGIKNKVENTLQLSISKDNKTKVTRVIRTR